VSNLMMASEARGANRAGSALWVQSASFRYGVGLLAVLLALFAQVVLEDILRDQSIYLLFVPAVLIAGGVGGLGPGAIATGSSIALGWLLYGSSEAGWQPWAIRTTVFAAIGLGAAAFGEFLQRVRLREASRTRDLLAREAHLQSILNSIPDAMIVIDEEGRRSFSPDGRSGPCPRATSLRPAKDARRGLVAS
jgi:two-component system, LuxR family, sensor kinase FixL